MKHNYKGTHMRFPNLSRFAMATALAVLFAPAAIAQDIQDAQPLEITFKNGVVTPSELHVPAGTVLEITVINDGDRVAEFDSKSLHVERVLGPHTRAVITLRNLAPGTYAFSEEFSGDQDTARGVIIAEPAD